MIFPDSETKPSRLVDHENIGSNSSKSLEALLQWKTYTNSYSIKYLLDEPSRIRGVRLNSNINNSRLIIMDSNTRTGHTNII